MKVKLAPGPSAIDRVGDPRCGPAAAGPGDFRSLPKPWGPAL